MYAIKASTLTAIGDAIREKTGEFKTLYNQPAIYDFSHNWTTGQWVGQNTNNTTIIDIGEASKVLIKDIVMTANNPDASVFYNLYLSSFNTYQSMGEYQYGVETNPTEIICNTPTVAGENLWFGTRCSTQSTNVSITATIVHLDANGEVLMNKTVEVLNTMTPMQMVEAIEGIETKVPADPIVLTGDCQYACTGPIAGVYIKANGDMITTKDISNAGSMFQKSILETIPFDLNFKQNSNVNIGYMF
jgi:hypothetical protein